MATPREKKDKFPVQPDKDTLEFKDISEERSRTYNFGDGRKVVIVEPALLCVRPSGGHRVETKDGRKHIINKDWVSIEVDTDRWSF